MSSKKSDINNEHNKLNAKDFAIIVLGVIMLMLMIVIVFMARRNDQMIAESLQNNSEISVDEAVNKNVNNFMDELEISEINADKWIEFHNLSTESLDISGLKIKASGEVIASIDEGSFIKKNDYFVVELSKNPAKSNKNIITICDVNDTEIKFLMVPKLDAKKSFGISNEELNIWGYMEPTRGKANSEKVITYIEDGGIGISAPGGFYDTSFDLELYCDEGEKIYYTTDCSTPTTESSLFEKAIHISNNSGSKYIYAREAVYDAFTEGYMPGTVDAGTIVRAIKVDASGNIIGEMSQAYYVGLSKDTDYLNLPVISLTTDPYNLFDYENGIYIGGKLREDAIIQGLKGEYSANYYNPWKKPVKIEYYEPSKDKTFELDGTFNITIDQNVAARQKSLTVNLDKEKCDEYSGSSILNFISSNGNLSLTTNFEDNDIKIRHLLASEMADSVNVGIQKIQLCSVFLDGEYWGLYCIRQDYNDQYFADNFGIKNEEIIIRNAGEYNENFLSFYSFVTENNMAIEQNYLQVQEMMDIDNFIDYICLNIYLGNTGFSPHNGTAWRTVNTNGNGMADGKWRFISGDLSKTMYLTASQTPTINSFLQPGVQGDLLFQSLLMNDEFCQMFEKRMKNMARDEFTPDNCNEKIDEIINMTKKATMASYTRFHGLLTDSVYSSEIERIQAFLILRSEYIIKYTEELAKKGGDLQKARELTENAESNENDNNEIPEAEEQLNAENSEIINEAENADETENADEADNADEAGNAEDNTSG